MRIPKPLREFFNIVVDYHNEHYIGNKSASKGREHRTYDIHMLDTKFADVNECKHVYIDRFEDGTYFMQVIDTFSELEIDLRFDGHKELMYASMAREHGMELADANYPEDRAYDKREQYKVYGKNSADPMDIEDGLFILLYLNGVTILNYLFVQDIVEKYNSDMTTSSPNRRYNGVDITKLPSDNDDYEICLYAISKHAKCMLEYEVNVSLIANKDNVGYSINSANKSKDYIHGENIISKRRDYGDTMYSDIVLYKIAKHYFYVDKENSK